ncbi:MAG: hypothetical protein E3J87_09555 [Candidatus Cloacimonadota bacterium]|nr:MAG: hypothetical protein E3J87_09555 [Candidatus Cloacimonadota bacterium]
MRRTIQRKFLKTASILLFISGISILFLVIITFLHCKNLLQYLDNLEFIIITGPLEMFYLYEAALKYRIVFPLIFAGFGLIDFVCSIYVFKGNNVFRWIAYVRSFVTSLIGATLILWAFVDFNISIMEGIVYFIYYGLIFILLILSRKDLASTMPKEENA